VKRHQKEKKSLKLAEKVENENSLTKEKLWESYGKPWAIYGPYVGMVWKGRVVIWN